MRKYMTKRQRAKQGILISLVVLLGLGGLAYTGKVLDDKYQWVEKVADKFKPAVPDEEADTIQLRFNVEQYIAAMDLNNATLFEEKKADSLNISTFSGTLDEPNISLNFKSEFVNLIFEFVEFESMTLLLYDGIRTYSSEYVIEETNKLYDFSAIDEITEDLELEPIITAL